MYLKEHPNLLIGRTLFWEMKPTEVSCFGDLPLSVCVCRYHENVRLILDVMHPHTRVPRTFREFISLVTCDQTKKACMTRKCDQCRDKIDGLDPRLFVADDTISTKCGQWTWTSKEVQKKVMKCLQDCFYHLKEQLPYFLQHAYVKRVQATFFQNTTASVNGKQIALPVYFAENFAMKQQNEIKSAHWSHQQCSIFTAYAVCLDFRK